MSHTTDAIVITCIDFRFQKFIKDWLSKRFPHTYEFDRVALAGGIFDLYAILHQVEISNSLHKIKTAILINHEDCGAYGSAGTYDRHMSDLARAKKTIETLYPNLNVESYYLHLNGTFEPISSLDKARENF
jgi:carbonic anhydrase